VGVRTTVSSEAWCSAWPAPPEWAERVSDASLPSERLRGFQAIYGKPVIRVRHPVPFVAVTWITAGTTMYGTAAIGDAVG
jgi:hypothetical protein